MSPGAHVARSTRRGSVLSLGAGLVNEVVLSCEEFRDNFAVNVSEAEVATLVVVGQACVIESELVQHSRLEVVHVNRVLLDVVPEFIGRPVGETRFHSATSHPH